MSGVLTRRHLLIALGGGAALAVQPMALRPALARDPLVLGEFQLDPTGSVVDGDTVKVLGLDASLRLIGIDTEETFKNKEDERQARKDFAAYAAHKRGDGPLPAKYATPAGEFAADWAKAWFRGVKRVRLEYDETERTIDVYGRLLVHIFALKGGRWQHFNVAIVASGWTPYFNKYGNSLRFHDAFVKAQEQARAAKVGVWDDAVEHYPDYDERLPWWNRRAAQLEHYAATHGDDPTYVRLGEPTAFDRLMNAEGQRRVVFGVMSTDAPKDDRKPYRRSFGHMNRQNFYVISFELPALLRLKLRDHVGYYVYMEGVVASYRNKPQFEAQGVLRVWQEPTPA